MLCCCNSLPLQDVDICQPRLIHSKLEVHGAQLAAIERRASIWQRSSGHHRDDGLPGFCVQPKHGLLDNQPHRRKSQKGFSPACSHGAPPAAAAFARRLAPRRSLCGRGDHATHHLEYGTVQKKFDISEETITPARLRDKACRQFNIDAKGKNLYFGDEKLTTGTRMQVNSAKMKQMFPSIRETSVLVLL